MNNFGASDMDPIEKGLLTVTTEEISVRMRDKRPGVVRMWKSCQKAVKFVFAADAQRIFPKLDLY